MALPYATEGQLKTVERAVESKVEGIEGKIDEKLESVESKITGVESKVKTVETKVSSIQTAVNGKLDKELTYLYSGAPEFKAVSYSTGGNYFYYTSNIGPLTIIPGIYQIKISLGKTEGTYTGWSFVSTTEISSIIFQMQLTGMDFAIYNPLSAYINKNGSLGFQANAADCANIKTVMDQVVPLVSNIEITRVLSF